MPRLPCNTVWLIKRRSGMAARLSKQDWIAHGLEVLKSDGHEGLKADRMVRALDVSRGSFYWHFKDIGDFHGQLIAAWRVGITESVIADLQALPEGSDPLCELITRVLSVPQRLERAIRLWAGASRKVAEAVAEVDRLRVGFVSEHLQRLGLSKQVALDRAVFLGWAYVGHALSGADVPDAAKRAADCAHMLTRPEELA